MNCKKTVVAEYIWLGGNNELRSKKRVIEVGVTNTTIWNIDDNLHVLG